MWNTNHPKPEVFFLLRREASRRGADLRHLISPPDAKSRRIVTAAAPKKRAAPRLPLPGPHTGAPHFPTEPSLPAPAGAAAAPGLSPAGTAACSGPPEPLSHRLLRLPPSGRDTPSAPAPSETGQETPGGSGGGGTGPGSLRPPAARGCGQEGAREGRRGLPALSARWGGSGRGGAAALNPSGPEGRGRGRRGGAERARAASPGAAAEPRRGRRPGGGAA